MTKEQLARQMTQHSLDELRFIETAISNLYRAQAAHRVHANGQNNTTLADILEKLEDYASEVHVSL